MPELLLALAPVAAAVALLVLVGWRSDPTRRQR